MQNPEALVSQVLKARYFQCSSFMEAKLGSNPSFVWRSILWGRQLLHKGLRWRIDNGEQLCIYKSNWILEPETLKPFSPQILPSYFVVADLISNQQWKEDVIVQIFMKEDAERILTIPLPRVPQLDQLIWHFDKNEIYSIKSGYQIALKLKFSEVASNSNMAKTH